MRTVFVKVIQDNSASSIEMLLLTNNKYMQPTGKTRTRGMDIVVVQHLSWLNQVGSLDRNFDHPSSESTLEVHSRPPLESPSRLFNSGGIILIST